MKIPFHQSTGALLHEQEIPDATPELWRLKVAVELSIRARANLVGASLDGASLTRASLDGASLARASLTRANLVGASLACANLARANLDGANLDGANLDGANLVGANLTRASLVGASLVGASLVGASLDGAYLARANLARASLVGASLDGANLDGANLVGASLDEHTKLVGARPVLQIGPLGSRCAHLTAYITNRGVMVWAGCFFDTLAQFELAVQNTHGSSNHGREYTAAVTLIRAHAEIWTPAADAVVPAEPAATE